MRVHDEALIKIYICAYLNMDMCKVARYFGSIKPLLTSSPPCLLAQLYKQARFPPCRLRKLLDPSTAHSKCLSISIFFTSLWISLGYPHTYLYRSVPALTAPLTINPSCNTSLLPLSPCLTLQIQAFVMFSRQGSNNGIIAVIQHVSVHHENKMAL